MASELGVQTIQHTNGTDALTIDSSGNLTAPQSLVITNQPRLFVTGSNGAYVNTTPIPFPNVVIDNRSGWSTSNNEYTVPVAGDYFVNVCLGIVRTQGTNGNGFAEIQHNGNNTGYSYIEIPSGTQYGPLAVTRIFTCAANDTLRVRWGGSGGDYYNNIRECRLTIYMLG